MKKIIAVLLALVIVASVGVIAVAVTYYGTSVNHSGSLDGITYTIQLPADWECPYNAVDDLNVAPIRLLSWSDSSARYYLNTKWTALTNTEDPSDTLSEYYVSVGGVTDRNNDTKLPLLVSGSAHEYSLIVGLHSIAGATPGATYQSTFTYTLSVEKP